MLALAHSGGDAQRVRPPASEPKGFWGDGGSPELQCGVDTHVHTRVHTQSCHQLATRSRVRLEAAFIPDTLRQSLALLMRPGLLFFPPQKVLFLPLTRKGKESIKAVISSRKREERVVKTEAVTQPEAGGTAGELQEGGVPAARAGGASWDHPS